MNWSKVRYYFRPLRSPSREYMGYRHFSKDWKKLKEKLSRSGRK